MRAKAAIPPVEVYCNQCQVTFPVGNRRCLHCGARLQSDQATNFLAVPPGVEFEPDVEVEVEEPELARRRSVSPIAGIWLVLAVVITIVRSCTSG